MRSTSFARLSALVIVSLLLAASTVQAGVHYVHGGYYGYPHCYSSCFSFGFAYAPAPVFVAPPPVVYCPPPVVVAPPVFVAPPVVVQRPVVVQAPPPVVVRPATQPAPSFIETNRRYHRHGDNKGLLDWVEGLLDGQPVRIYYDDFGRVKEQELID